MNIIGLNTSLKLGRLTHKLNKQPKFVSNEQGYTPNTSRINVLSPYNS